MRLLLPSVAAVDMIDAPLLAPQIATVNVSVTVSMSAIVASASLSKSDTFPDHGGCWAL